MKPGYHTLEIHGKNLAGEDIVLYKTIYVAEDGTTPGDEGWMTLPPGMERTPAWPADTTSRRPGFSSAPLNEPPEGASPTNDANSERNSDRSRPGEHKDRQQEAGLFRPLIIGASMVTAVVAFVVWKFVATRSHSRVK